MTEVPGTDRDQARKNVHDETPVLPDGIHEDTSTRGDDEETGEEAKPHSHSTDLGTE